MRATLLIASTFASLAVADSTAEPSSTTIKYLDISADGGGVNLAQYTSFVGDVYAIDRTATTYKVRCEDGVPSSDCIIDSKTPWILVQGPATYALSATAHIKTAGGTGAVTVDMACSFTHSTESISCSESVGIYASAAGQSTSTSGVIPSYTIDAEAVSYTHLKVTGGLKAFSADATATAPVTVSYKDAGQPVMTAAPLVAAAAAAVVGVFI
ncbi:hypothetical protein N7478_003699 [Penicillium angulare]|uniref:uncharacterized protein n=1 Tax=Penicillium angulare TaxID=116970 RepID=UPI002540529A|nr:uncharacterized protein N7478_003699 [Penicillium angulare]KAJ5288013.1 hypothetical protein N7478_003699 [Penicillium angulare]